MRLMRKGKVKWFSNDRGYGFIQPEEGGPDVFVHIRDVEASGLRTLAEGQAVTFDMKTERGKTSATNLRAA
jgi:cold shock protein